MADPWMERLENVRVQLEGRLPDRDSTKKKCFKDVTWKPECTKCELMEDCKSR